MKKRATQKSRLKLAIIMMSCFVFTSGCSMGHHTLYTAQPSASVKQKHLDSKRAFAKQMNNAETFATCASVLYPGSGVVIPQLSTQERRNKFLEYALVTYAKSSAKRSNGEIFALLSKSIQEFNPLKSPDPWNRKRVSTFLKLCDLLASKTKTPLDTDKRNNVSYTNLRIVIREKFLD